MMLPFKKHYCPKQQPNVILLLWFAIFSSSSLAAEVQNETVTNETEIWSSNGVVNLPAYHSSGSWPGYMCTNRLSKHNLVVVDDDDDVVEEYQLTFSIREGNGGFAASSPMLSQYNGLIIAATGCTSSQCTDSAVEAYDTTTGELVWSFLNTATAIRGFHASPVSGGGCCSGDVIVGSTDGYVYKLNSRTGRRESQVLVPGAVTTAAAAVGLSEAYVVSIEGSDNSDRNFRFGTNVVLSTIDMFNGKIKFQVDGLCVRGNRSYNIVKGVALANGDRGNPYVLLACGCGILEAYRVTGTQGTVLEYAWNATLHGGSGAGRVFREPPLVDPTNTVPQYAIQSWGNRPSSPPGGEENQIFGLTKLNIEDGSVIWEAYLDNDPISMAIHPETGTIYGVADTYVSSFAVFKVDPDGQNVTQKVHSETGGGSGQNNFLSPNAILLDTDGNLIVGLYYHTVIVDAETLDIKQSIPNNDPETPTATARSETSPLVGEDGGIWRFMDGQDSLVSKWLPTAPTSAPVPTTMAPTTSMPTTTPPMPTPPTVPPAPTPDGSSANSHHSYGCLLVVVLYFVCWMSTL